MLGQPPRFWWTAKPTFAARLLSPLGHLYGAVSARRMRRPGRQLEIPVICIGNFVAGGAGKTPAAIAVAQRLIAAGESPAFLSRGYGRKTHMAGVLHVDPDRHDARHAGDEPLLLARIAPTFVAGNRLAAAKAAILAGASVLVLDDGLQSPALAKDASIAIVDGVVGIGNGLCHPAGPLRAPLNAQWPAVSLLCVLDHGDFGSSRSKVMNVIDSKKIEHNVVRKPVPTFRHHALGEDLAGSHLADQALLQGIPVLRAALRPDPVAVLGLRHRRLFAFAGIGRPDKFFRTLEGEELSVVGRREFPDHHWFSEEDLRALQADAATLGADLVTTEKDRVRLPAEFPAVALPVSMHMSEAAPLDALLARLTAGWKAPA